MFITNFIGVFSYVSTLMMIIDVTEPFELGVEQQMAINESAVYSVNDRTSNVSIKNVHCQVYSYDPVEHHENRSHSKALRSKSMKFYTCLNCVFADWIRNRLQKSIERAPLTYNKIFRRKYNNNGPQYEFESENSAGQNAIVEYAMTFTNILFNFLHTYTYVALLDTSLLVSLVSLQFKIDTSNEADGDVALSKILGVVNAVQKFETFNCGTVIYDRGYSSERTDIDDFLKSVAKPLQNGRGLCGTDRMLLTGRLLSRADHDIVARDLSETKVRLSCRQTTVSVAEIYEQVRRTDDLEVIVWYQRVVYEAIVRALCARTHRFVTFRPSWKKDQEKIAEKLGRLSFVYADRALLPADLVDAMEFVATVNNTPSDRRTRERTLKQFVENRARETGNADGGRSTPFVLDADKNRYEESDPVELEAFLDAMLEHRNDYECFVDVYRVLRDEYSDRYYVPHSRNPRKVQRFVNRKICAGPDANVTDPVVVGRGCSLVTNLYQYCLESFIELNNRRSGLFPRIDGDDQFPDEIAEILRNTVNLLSSFSVTYTWKPVTRLTYDLVPLLVALRSELFRSDNFYDLLRLIYLIKTDLNGFGIEHCNATEYNLLMINNVDFDAIGLHTNNLRDSNLINQTDNIAEYPDTYYFTFTRLTQQFHQNSKAFVKYNNIIDIYWKGELKPIVDVYLSISSAVSAPRYVFGLYDVCLKFYLAVIFYKTEMFYAAMSEKNNEVSILRGNVNYYGFANFKKDINLPVNLFPKVFHRFIRFYNSYLLNIFCHFLFSEILYSKLREQIVEEFKNMGLFIFLENVEILPNINPRQIVDKYTFYHPFNKNITSFYIDSPKSSIHKQYMFFNIDFYSFNVSVNEILDDINDISKEFRHFNEYYG